MRYKKADALALLKQKKGNFDYLFFYCLMTPKEKFKDGVNGEYEQLFKQTESLVMDIFSEREVRILSKIVSPLRNEDLFYLGFKGPLSWIDKGAEQLRNKFFTETRIRRISAFLEECITRVEGWTDDAESNLLVSTSNNWWIEQAKEITVGDKPTYNIGDIHANQSNVSIGENISAINHLSKSGQTELATVLKALTEAITNSKDLPDDEKQNQIDLVTQIGREAAKSRPNRSLLKALWDGLVKTLQTVPDVAKAVVIAAPLFKQLHL